MSAAKTLYLLKTKQLTVDLLDTPNQSDISLRLLFKILGKDIKQESHLFNFIVKNCMNSTYRLDKPCFKIARNKKGIPTYYIIDRAITSFITTYEKNLVNFGVSPTVIQKTLQKFNVHTLTQDAATLQKILKPITTPKFHYHNLKASEIVQLLNETILDEKGQPTQVFFLTNKDGKSQLAVRLKHIAPMLQKFGKFFGVSNEYIQKAQQQAQTPFITNEMMSLSDFAKKTNSPHEIASYLKEKATTMFQEEFKGNNPTLIEAQNVDGKKDIYFNQNNIPSFVSRHFLTLLLLGFNKEMAQQIIKDKKIPVLPTAKKITDQKPKQHLSIVNEKE